MHRPYGHPLPDLREALTSLCWPAFPDYPWWDEEHIRKVVRLANEVVAYLITEAAAHGDALTPEEQQAGRGL